ncbi:MAG: hypothetical protein R3B70_33065 [Polyangiaceae bacterium]
MQQRISRTARVLGASLVAVAALVAASCGSEPAGERHEQRTNGGLYTVSWAPVPSPIPVAELFELDVTARAADGGGAETLSLVVIMPAHDHGMQTKHRVEPAGGGRFRITGMKMHMRGLWELHFRAGGRAGEDLVTFPVELR